MAAPLTESQIAIVKATAPVLKEHGVAITTVFYGNMLRENPELHNIFSTTSQTTGRQPRALAGAVLSYATYIDDLPKLTHAVERIAHKHVSLQVAPEQYDIVGKYLIQAIGQVLGDAATPAIVDAWTAAYGMLANVFINREGEMYKANAAENWVGWRKFRIVRKVPESSVITSFYLAPADGQTPLPRYLPGQYVSLQVPVPELGYLQSRQYSLSEGPTAGPEYYRISVKREDAVGEAGVPGLISNMLHARYAVGDEVELSHPQGEFFVDPTDTSKDGVPAVLISTGVGATPLKAMLDSLTAASAAVVKRPVSWIHASRSRAMQPFADAVRQICREKENVTANVFLHDLGPEDQAGVHYEFGETRMDLAKLDRERDLFLGDARAEYYICAPEPFMLHMRAVLMAMGVDQSRIFLELFATGDVAA
ncbi:oxidoreductase-like protein [Parathielavia hyrcaniae]|uniref:nitric oxide dioxygenase n=1 Tax=Parathielavia hyrcaniae TaxID=113614 RepID=A0AAN6Q0F2_9PEZI|nr:oxidoreductase-like protein [Parathielavia hyrcaniae]